MHGWTCGCGAVEKLARLQPPPLLLVVPKHDGFHPSAQGRGSTPVMKAGKFGEKNSTWQCFTYCCLRCAPPPAWGKEIKNNKLFTTLQPPFPPQPDCFIGFTDFYLVICFLFLFICDFLLATAERKCYFIVSFRGKSDNGDTNCQENWWARGIPATTHLAEEEELASSLVLSGTVEIPVAMGAASLGGSAFVSATAAPCGICL